MTKLEYEDYLIPDDIGERSIVTFIDEGAYFDWTTLGDKDPGRVFRIKVRLPDLKEKSWTPNVTSQRNIAYKLTKDTATWKGKTWPLITVNQNVNGKIRKVIYAAES